MCANTQPHGGIVFLGVGNDGELLGCSSTSQSHLNDLRAVSMLCPGARYEVKKIPAVNSRGDDDFVLAVRVHYRPDRLVECTSGDAYIREGSSKRRLSEAEKREIRLNKGEIDFESERVSLAFPDDFDANLLEEFYEQFTTKRNLKPDNFTIVDVLKLAKMGVQGPSGFVPNIACAIIFAKDPLAVVPGAYIRVRRYGGTEEQFGTTMNVEADERFDSPLPRQLVEAEQFIASQISNFTRLGSDVRFVTSPEYPREVWLEAVVNAAVHRLYNLRNMPIFVKCSRTKWWSKAPAAFCRQPRPRLCMRLTTHAILI